MPDDNPYLSVEDRGNVSVLRLKPANIVRLPDIDFSNTLFDAIDACEARGSDVLVVSVPRANFAPDRMDEFWKTAAATPPDKWLLQARHAYPIDRPASVVRMETAVGRLLESLQRTNLFKIICFEGEVDFDVLGLVLSFDLRICSPETTFKNCVFDRGVVPGFGVLWYLTRYLGQAAALDLVLNQSSLSAEEAYRCLVNRIEPSASLESAGVSLANSIAGRPRAVLQTLAHASKFLEYDLSAYLRFVGGGFTKLPTADSP